MEIKQNFILNQNTLFSKEGPFYWPSTFNEATLFLEQVPFSKSKDILLERISFSNDFSEKTKNWDFVTTANSALYFFLEEKINERILNEESIFNRYDCYIIFLLLLNPALSKQTITFVENLYKIPQKIKVSGGLYLFRNYFLFDVIEISPNSLDNFLEFLNIDSFSKNYLVKKTFKEKSFQMIESFLFLLDCNLNGNFILTETLANYKKYKNNTISKNTF